MLVFTGIQPRPSASLTNITLLPSTGVKRSEARTRSPGRMVTPCRQAGQAGQASQSTKQDCHESTNNIESRTKKGKAVLRRKMKHELGMLQE